MNEPERQDPPAPVPAEHADELEREVEAPAELLVRAGLLAPGEGIEALSDPVRLAALLTAAVRLYGAAVADGAIGPQALEGTSDLQATEVLHAVTGLMAAADLEMFELTMWKAWGRA